MSSFEKNPFNAYRFVKPFHRPEADGLDTIAKISTPDITESERKVYADNYSKAATREFGTDPILKESIENHQLNEKLDQETREKRKLEAFFQCGDTEMITDFLLSYKGENIYFNNEISKLKSEYSKELADATFLNEKDWQILTALKLYDKPTLEHSIGTYLIVRQKIEQEMVELSSDIKREGVQNDQLYRGALLHDIGKLAIPKFLLNSKITDAEWTFHFCQLDKEKQDDILAENFIVAPDNIRDDIEQMTKFFHERRIRAVKFIPIGSVLSQEQKQLLENSQLAYNITDEKISNLSLGKILELHEKKSEDILQKFGYYVEALLAGNHHNYKHKDKNLGEKPVSLSIAGLSIETASNIIHLADVEHALNGNRSYHLKNPMLRILAFMADAAEQKQVDRIVAAKWILNSLKKMSPSYLHEVRTLLAKRQHHEYLLERKTELERIDEFLYDNLPEEYHYNIPDEYHYKHAA